MSAVIECEAITHAFGRGELTEVVLRDITASFNAGEAAMLMGPSGSGKTTLLSILGCLLTPSRGEVRVCGETVSGVSIDRLSRIRRDRFGFVFQHAQLLPFLSINDNLLLVGRNAGIKPSELHRRITFLLDRLGLTEIRNKAPRQLSGGQQQRVAIARAVLHRPQVILADEPTAALDWEHGERALRLLIESAREEGAFLLTVTHDIRLAPFFSRRLEISAGQLAEATRC